MWLIFNSSGSLIRTSSSEPNPVDVSDNIVIESELEFNFQTTKYSLVGGELVEEPFVQTAPPDVAPQTIHDKLANAGISLEELKTALGL